RQNVDDERLDGGADGSSTSPAGNRPLLSPVDGEDGPQAIPLRHVTSQVVDRHKIGQIFGVGTVISLDFRLNFAGTDVHVVDVQGFAWSLILNGPSDHDIC
ncbi:hypothetical protein COOONC_19286, partial [Cooperia oncophora]